MNGRYEDDAPAGPPSSPQDGGEHGEPFGDEELDSPARRAGWLARILLILLAMAMVPWLVEQCEDPDGRLPVREEAPPAPGAGAP